MSLARNRGFAGKEAGSNSSRVVENLDAGGGYRKTERGLKSSVETKDCGTDIFNNRIKKLPNACKSRPIR